MTTLERRAQELAEAWSHGVSSKHFDTVPWRVYSPEARDGWLAVAECEAAAQKVADERAAACVALEAKARTEREGPLVDEIRRRMKNCCPIIKDAYCAECTASRRVLDAHAALDAPSEPERPVTLAEAVDRLCKADTRWEPNEMEAVRAALARERAKARP